MAFEEVDIRDLQINPFTKIGDEWMLVTAGDERGFNTMTASWGGLGVLWSRDVATCYIRPTRYTKEFIDAADRLTLSFYGPEHKRALGVLGTKSGRDCDKVAEVGFTPLFLDGTCAFEEAELILVCRKLYADPIKPECFIDTSCDEENYPLRDYHVMYISEVERVLARA